MTEMRPYETADDSFLRGERDDAERKLEELYRQMAMLDRHIEAEQARRDALEAEMDYRADAAWEARDK